MQCVRRVQINIVVATPPEVRLAPCNLAPPSNSREQPGVIPGSCPWEKSPLSTMDQYLYSRLHASIYLDRSCLRFMKLCTKAQTGTVKNFDQIGRFCRKFMRFLVHFLQALVIWQCTKIDTYQVRVIEIPINHIFYFNS